MMADTQTKRVVSYIRLSVDDPASLSPQVQETSIRRYCELRGLELAELISDLGVSGGIPLEKRPGGSRLLELLQKGEATGVVAIKHDRIWRSVCDGLLTVERWRRAGVALHLTDLGGTALDTSTAFGWLMFCQLLAFSEAERRITGERTVGAMKLKRTLGEKTGGHLPYGFQTGYNGKTRFNRKTGKDEPVKILVPEPHEQWMIGEIRRRAGAGDKPQEIADRFNHTGQPARDGRLWRPPLVKKILEREAAHAPAP